MKLERLRCFLSVAKTLNFSQSAKELYLSQPSISRIIRSLEDEVGAPLLNRAGKQMALTQEGEIFLRHCKKMVFEWDKAITEIRSVQMGSHALTVGMIGFAEERLTVAIDALGKKYPQLSLQIVPVDFSRPFDALESEHMDCLLYWPELKPGSVEYLPLFEGEIHAYLNKNHPLCKKEQVSIKDIVSIPNIVFGNINVQPIRRTCGMCLRSSKKYEADQSPGCDDLPPHAGAESGRGALSRRRYFKRQ